MRDRLFRWIARWLDRRGLGSVADVLDASDAGADNVEARHALARRALASGRASEAITQLEAATHKSPEDPTLWCSLGAAYRHADRYADAELAYRRALSLKPDYPQALSNLGEWCLAQRRIEAALDWFDQALAVAPDFFEARLNKTAALFELGRYEEARHLAEQLVEDHPARPEAHLNLGNVLVHTGKIKQGSAHYRKALQLRPGYIEAHFNLACLFGTPDELANAIGYLERQIQERGESMQLLGFLAAARNAKGEIAEAEKLCRRILEQQPQNTTALVTLGSCLSSGGDSAAALQIYERVAELDGKQPAMYSNILFECNNQSQLGRTEIFQRHLDWAERFEKPLLKRAPPAVRNRDPERKLRIGYVSGDFTQHPVGFLLRDILRYHDPARFDIYCYSMVIRESDVLPELRAAAKEWHDIFFMSDDELVDLIQSEEIDILVDLSGHTAYHRLLVFARRPAPVQVEWIGYFHSTGMSAIDYFITDPHTSPPGGDQLFSETPVYLPHTRFCYGPSEYSPEVVPPPMETSGRVTFGSFNRLSKVTDEVVAAWSRILLGVENSRMIVKAAVLADPLIRDRLAARFAACGVERDRLDFRDRSPHGEMLAQYGDMDIALDTFPFNGGMTTMEALWMGIPVVTVAGDSVVSRQTLSILNNLDIPDLAFPDVDAYVQGAIALARDATRLKDYRARLRPAMARSPIRRAAEFTRDLEDLYRRMWRAYCANSRLPSAIAADAHGIS
jgi:predicted O-linked N-acetylglucosamine transferase (SPINDLY family)